MTVRGESGRPSHPPEASVVGQAAQTLFEDGTDTEAMIEEARRSEVEAVVRNLALRIEEAATHASGFYPATLAEANAMDEVGFPEDAEHMYTSTGDTFCVAMRSMGFALHYFSRSGSVSDGPCP